MCKCDLFLVAVAAAQHFVRCQFVVLCYVVMLCYSFRCEL